MELGDYQAAERALAEIPPLPDDLSSMALRARILTIRGKPDQALDLLEAAVHRADELYDLPHETVAWYHTMVGHALIDNGKLEEGEKACTKALEIFPGDYRAMTGLAEAAAWRRDWEGSLAWGRKAIRVAPQNPEVLKLLGEAYEAQGKGQEAEQHFQRLDELAHSFPRIYDRHWALFCAGKDRGLDEALALARKDLELRQDVHAYDTLAWVSFKKGLLPEAEAAMRKALAQGTQDASFCYHAGMIARARDDRPQAKEYFTRARAINPLLIPVRWLRWLDENQGPDRRENP
jgi:tetratricopeptide (TPR) repeat protein